MSLTAGTSAGISDDPGDFVQPTLTDDLDRFWAAAGSWLASRPVENNLLLTAIASQRAGQTKGDRPPVFAWVAGDDGVCGAMRWPPPLPATITAMPDDAARALAATLAAQCIPLPGVNGPRPAVSAFATRWQELTGQAVSQARNLVLSSLSDVKLTEWPEGRMRPARPDEAPLFTEWIAKVLADAGLPASEESARQQIDEQLGGGRLHVWEDGGHPVAVLGHAAPVSGAVLLHGVYSPPEHRTTWYGAALVAAVAAHLLGSGCTACLSISDQANRYAMAGMRVVGYEPVLELAECRFHAHIEPTAPPA